MNKVFCVMLLCISGLAFTSCKSSGDKLVPVAGYEPVTGTVQAAPRVIVYKTSGDYLHNVAVTLSPDRKKIVSYPAPSDVSVSSVPVKLKDGYLLDRRGVSEFTAFLSYTYEEYAALEKTPSIEELEGKIIDYNPIIEMWDCGSAYESGRAGLHERLDELVSSGFEGCRRLK